MNKLTDTTFDGRYMRVDDVRDIDVKFATMVIGYKVYQSNWLNSVVDNNILVAYQMVKADAHYDLCSVMLKQLMTNMQKIKQEKQNTFQYDSFIICLVFYFLGTVPGFGKTQWAFDRPVATQITQILDRQEENNKKANVWEFFKTFQEEMKNRSQISKSIIEKYKETIFFMVDKDECMMEVVKPRTIQIMPMGYDFEEAMLDAYEQYLLQSPVDKNEDKFGIAKDKGLKVHQEQVALAIQKKMTWLAAKTLISEDVDRSKVEKHVKILEEHRKKELKHKRKEEREAQKAAQATPNVVLVTSRSSKQLKVEPTSQTLVEPPKKKYKATWQYMIVSS